MASRRRTVLLWSVASALLLLVVVKFYVADLYPVESESMRPTIFGGVADGEEAPITEWVLVRYDHAPAVKRFDLVVWKPKGGGNPVVKRVAGLPGERILISGGDLLVEGERLPAGTPRPAPIVVFDQTKEDVASSFQLDPARWSQAGGVWRVDATGVRPDSRQGMLLYHEPLTDDYLDPDGRRVRGLAEVNDAIVRCEVRLDPPSADPGGGDGEAPTRLRLELVEEGDTFDAVIEAGEAGGFVARITRRNPELPFAELWSGSVPFVAGAWQRLSFANVDNVLTLEVGSSFHEELRYEANVPLGNALGAKTLGPRAGLGAEGCRASFRGITLLRDLYYTASGDHAVGSMLALGPDEYFLLGDNSSHSQDSRHFGPVPAAEIVGRPVAVVWPPSRARLLR